MVVVGVLGALMAPATMALVTDLAGSGERGAAMAGFNIFGSVGFFVGIVLGGTLASAFGFRPAFLAVGALEVVVALIAWAPLLRLDLDPSSTFRR
jgi:MFS family permease